MNLENRINAFVKLGMFLGQFASETKIDELDALNKVHYDSFNELIARQKSQNGWFDRANVIRALAAIAFMLEEKQLKEWLKEYDVESVHPKHIGVIMAGNIPMVGFHDYLSVLIAGHYLDAKLSSKDSQLLVKITEVLAAIEPDLAARVTFKDKLENIDAIIATGSDNSARYFGYYFAKYPHIFRKNRNSVAVIGENDEDEELVQLGHDVFDFYGLGCRNVSKLFVPRGFELDRLFKGFYDGHKDVISNHKYANNYDYNKAIYLMGSEAILDNNFVLLREAKELGSPVGVLHYEFYDNIEQVEKALDEQKDEIQCVVSGKHTPLVTAHYGEAQQPIVSDYADGVDTIKFLTSLN